MFENGKNISQLIFCRLFTDLFGNDITVNFLGYSQLQNITKREKTNEILILTLFTAFTTVLYIGGC
jgi:hypothetical protein